MISSAELRNKFLTYFENNGHKIVASSPLVPGNDPTLLFTNAGMVQFKDVFLGEDKRSYKTATTSQRCVRAGGKHNDLENVGYTARHHTFFEMLGNFSFGDYFKRDAIKYAWQFLTEVIGLPAEKLWITVYETDDEAADIWLNEICVDPSHFTRIGDKPGGKPNESDNFWSMGDTGPCGPCSEIFYDHGADIWGGPPGTADEDGDRFIEIWNLVFMQFNRDVSGKMKPLPKPSVDTGMGLERLAAILQNVHNNYDIDIFQALIKAAAEFTGINDLENKSLRVIADHIRSCAFLIVDGVLPSNEGRGYVLRRIIRRAARHGHQLGCSEAFFYKLVPEMVAQMGEAYPELTKLQSHVAKVLRKEEDRFAETLSQGMKILEDTVAAMDGDTISGEVLFKLYDTYGFPLDLTADVAREKSLKIDQEGFDQAMAAQKGRARASSNFNASADGLDVSGQQKTRFQGYDNTASSAVVLGILKNGQEIDLVDDDSEIVVILDQTPFYGESGGQIGDTGLLLNQGMQFEVSDTQKKNDVFMHIGHLVEGQLKVGDKLDAVIDEERRQAVILNHSATHLMHAGLHQFIGDHVQQKGSLVDADKLRFDFSHYQPLTSKEILQIEEYVNDQIRLNLQTRSEVMDIEAAKNTGAKALFGEKYGDKVRVLSIGSDSVELCGGTHVKNAGDIGLFKIVLETGVASGVRRIEAITGAKALDRFAQTEAELDQVARLVKSGRDDVLAKIVLLTSYNKKLEKELEAMKSKLASQAGGDLASQAVDVKGIHVVAARLDGVSVKTLRETVDQLKNKLGAAAIVLASTEGDKITIIAGVSKRENNKIKAGDLVNVVAQPCGGRGGGRPDMAQAGGNKPEYLDQALESVVDWVREQL